MIHFLDASAIVELYAESELSRVEVPSAFWRKHRRGELDAPDAALLADAFEDDWKGSDGDRCFIVVGMSVEILDAAAGSTATLGLRAYDAVQLASGVAARNAEPNCRSFTSFGKQLNVAASTLGFEARPSGRGSDGRRRKRPRARPFRVRRPVSTVVNDQAKRVHDPRTLEPAG